MNIRRTAVSLLFAFLALALLAPAPAAAQAPVPTPGVGPSPGQPLTPQSVPAFYGRRFPRGRGQLLMGLIDANANVDNITAGNIVDVAQNNTLPPQAVAGMMRIVRHRPRTWSLAARLTQALRQRGLIGNSQAVIGVIGDRVFVATAPGP
jgi:hypothetical protein